jgi:hypothetical protein
VGSYGGSIHPGVEAGDDRLAIEVPDSRLRVDIASAVARCHAEEVYLPVAKVSWCAFGLEDGDGWWFG